MEIQLCQICRENVSPSIRYPNRVCDNCYNKAETEEGERIYFENEGISGGFIARRVNDNSIYKVEGGHLCFIDNVKCWAEEAYMGGIVIETFFPMICSGETGIKGNLRRLKLRLIQTFSDLNNLRKKDFYNFFYQIKFEKIGLNPLSSRTESENLIEQINQTFSSAVLFLALDYLYRKFGQEVYRINVQIKPGFDIVNEANTIGAEVFSTVSAKNNQKLSLEKRKLKNSNFEKKFVFYYSHEVSEFSETETEGINIVCFSKSNLEGALTGEP